MGGGTSKLDCEGGSNIWRSAAVHKKAQTFMRLYGMSEGKVRLATSTELLIGRHRPENETECLVQQSVEAHIDA